MNKNIKPFGHKAYGSIPHVTFSFIDMVDHCMGQCQAEFATKKSRDQNDLIKVHEKLEGFHFSVIKIHRKIMALSRSG